MLRTRSPSSWRARGRKGAALRSLAAEVAPGRVTFLGRLAKEELHDVMRSGCALAMPSRWYEDAPMIVLEAFACGLPVIGTLMGGVPELILPGEDGWLTPAEDVPALAGALTEAVTSPDRSFAMGRAGRRKMETVWTPTAHVAGLDRLYAEAGAGR